MLIAAIDPRTGKIVQVAFQGFDWGKAGACCVAYVQHTDQVVEATLTQQIAGGGLPYLAYPYAVIDPKTGKMTDFSNEYYDLKLLITQMPMSTICDRVDPSPMLDPVRDFTAPPLKTTAVVSTALPTA